MKTYLKATICAVFALFATTGLQATAHYGIDDEAVDTIHYNVYTGKVIDAKTKAALPFATIEASKLNIATVTNIDGEFILKVPKDKSVDLIKISFVGYQNAMVDVAKYMNLKSRVIALEPSTVNLQAVTIRAEDASGLIAEVLTNIRKNYSQEEMMMTAFYRETVKRRRNYVSISEAVVDIYKSPYGNDFRNDQAKLLQGRKSADVEKMDTVLFKLQGGPVTTLLLDVVKNPYILLSDQYRKVYNFYITGAVNIDDRLHYIVSFDQRDHVTMPFYNGKIYIDMERLAITEAEFELNMENEMEVASMFIRKKPVGMSVIPERAVYRTKYLIEGNKWFFSYARAEVKYKVDWDRKLFNTNYTTMSEIAITKREEGEAVRFANKERFKRSQVLDELVYVFFDQDFWGSYNVIEPDQSIESAIKRLNKKFLKSADEAVNP